MNTNPVLRVKDTVFGAGLPKICIPLVAKDFGELTAAAEAAADSPSEVIEWRADFYEPLKKKEEVPSALADAFALLRCLLPGRLLLFTIRTEKEGGAAAVTAEDYLALNEAALRFGKPDLIDAELSSGERVLTRLTRKAHEGGAFVIFSSHNFHFTPSKEEMKKTLQTMEALGADICKLAVMPRSKEDVLTLMAATRDRLSEGAARPLITMSMGQTGVISRIAGATFGSCMTFGTAGKSSAPGQIDAVRLAKILKLLNGEEE